MWSELTLPRPVDHYLPTNACVFSWREPNKILPLTALKDLFIASRYPKINILAIYWYGIFHLRRRRHLKMFSIWYNSTTVFSLSSFSNFPCIFFHVLLHLFNKRITTALRHKSLYDITMVGSCCWLCYAHMVPRPGRICQEAGLMADEKPAEA